MTQLYVITPPVTLRGEPAGPNENEYLEFEAGDVVEIASDEDREWEPAPGISVVSLIGKPDFQQELDTSSLVEFNESETAL